MPMIAAASAYSALVWNPLPDFSFTRLKVLWETQNWCPNIHTSRQQNINEFVLMSSLRGKDSFKLNEKMPETTEPWE